MSKGVRARANIQFSDKLLADIDELAESLSLSRSAFVNMAVSKYIQQEKLMSVLPEFIELAKEERLKQLTE